MKSDTRVVLLSGGLDSSTCLAQAVDECGAKNVLALNMYYGQRHEREIESAQRIAVHYGVKYVEMAIDNVMRFSDSTMLAGRDDVPDGEYVEQMERDGKVSTYVPFRNGLLLSIAASVACALGYDAVVYGAHADDMAGNAYPDCSPEFVEYMKLAIEQGTGGAVTMYAPFITETKADIVATGLKLDVPYELTWSCYRGGEHPCGTCATCIDRKKAFEANGRKDPLL